MILKVTNFLDEIDSKIDQGPSKSFFSVIFALFSVLAVWAFVVGITCL